MACRGTSRSTTKRNAAPSPPLTLSIGLKAMVSASPSSIAGASKVVLLREPWDVHWDYRFDPAEMVGRGFLCAGRLLSVVTYIFRHGGSPNTVSHPLHIEYLVCY